MKAYEIIYGDITYRVILTREELQKLRRALRLGTEGFYIYEVEGEN